MNKDFQPSEAINSKNLLYQRLTEQFITDTQGFEVSNESILFRSLFSEGEKMAKTGSYILDVNTNSLQVSPGFVMLYELDEKDLTSDRLPMAAMSKVHPEDLHELASLSVKELLKKELSSSETHTVEYRIQTELSGVKWIRRSSKWMEEEEKLLVTLMDITDFKEAETKHQEKQLLLESGETTAMMGSVIYNSKTGHSILSNGIYEILEIDPDIEITDLVELLKEKIHPEDLDLWRSKIAEIPRTTEKSTYQYRIRKADESYKWVRVNRGVYLDKFTVIATLQDITEEVEVRHTLQQTNQELEQLIYTVSHDLRAPLRHINNYAQILRESTRDKLSEDEADQLAKIIKSTYRQGTMIDELLDYFRSRNHIMAPDWIKISDVIDEIFDLFSHETKERSIKWYIDTPHVIYADNKMLGKVFLNLLSNAVKFTSKTESPMIKVVSKSSPREVMVSVVDNGAGFDSRFKNKLFSVFQRLHKQRDFEGTGIGLASVHRIITRHGGSIWAESELDKGASFFFTIPQPLTNEKSG